MLCYVFVVCVFSSALFWGFAIKRMISRSLSAQKMWENQRTNSDERRLDVHREGIRGVANVALATPFFRFYFIKLSKKILKIILKILLNFYKYIIYKGAIPC